MRSVDGMDPIESEQLLDRLVRLLDEEDEFRLLASAGLATQFGAQALISMAVNTGLAPSKGMTLPFISYGGSSMIALSNLLRLTSARSAVSARRSGVTPCSEPSFLPLPRGVRTASKI